MYFPAVVQLADKRQKSRVRFRPGQYVFRFEDHLIQHAVSHIAVRGDVGAPGVRLFAQTSRKHIDVCPVGISMHLVEKNSAGAQAVLALGVVGAVFDFG